MKAPPAIANPDDKLRFDEILVRLDDCDWNAVVLARLLPQLQSHLPGAPLAKQLQWNAAVQGAWQKIEAQRDTCGEDLAFSLGTLAASTRCCQSALDYLNISLQWHGTHPATHHNLAVVYWRLARHAEADWQLRLALAASPDSPHGERQLATLAQWRKLCGMRLGTDQLHAQAKPGNVFLTLLGSHHAGALLQQQNAPDILAMVRLAPLHDMDDTRRWIDAHTAHRGKTAFGLIHADHGLVGVVVLQIKGKAALFHYWIGKEFRNCGYGRLALRLLKRVAIRRGIQHLFSAVFPGNVYSLAALDAAGFRRLAGVSEDGEDALPFHYLSIPSARNADPDGMLAVLNRVLKAANGCRAVKRDA
ncbi:GNAT family N-acetyltransferase [Duganella vulcania]|uniref:GNAT family N-acetyltransferase n=1 Tax=Duganella vulcania TaxID=2692166 RepID=A0A845GRK8_9BURK|nr:GNAT family protein [Duganella vulcania]MYM96255.1 GNAT family N-acetyltransferase [Duganella vulcania]